MFERDLPASVALAGVTAQGPVQPIYCPRHRHLQVQGADPPVSVSLKNKTNRKYIVTNKDRVLAVQVPMLANHFAK